MLKRNFFASNSSQKEIEFKFDDQPLSDEQIKERLQKIIKNLERNIDADK